MNTLGQNLVAYRKRAGLNQKDLASALGISPTRLNYWEKDKAKPTIEFIKKIAEALSISPVDLMGWSYFDEKHPDKIKELKKFEEFINFLKKSGYIYKQEVVKWHWEDENEADPTKKVQIPDEWEITLIKDGKEAKFTEAEFTEFQEFTKEAVEGKFYKKVIEKQKKNK